MKKVDSKELSKLGNSLISKVMEIEKVDLLYDIRDLLAVSMRSYESIEAHLATIATNMKPYDYFDILKISSKEAHEKKRAKFFTNVFKIVVLPTPVHFMLWVEDYRVAENMYEFYANESMEIERKCREIYYSNDAHPGIEEEIRIHIFGRW